MFSNDMFSGMVMGIFLAGMIGMAILGGIGYGIYWLWTTYDIVPERAECRALTGGDKQGDGQ